MVAGKEPEFSMERLWSPWRSEYVSGDAPASDSCIFCAFPRQQDDAANLIAYRGERAYVVMNRFPYNSGHLMIVPYQHASAPQALPTEASAELMSLLNRCLTALAHSYSPDGYNVGMNLGSAAGAGIADHLHVHIVPRWNGDANFMATIGDTKVIPERLQQSYEKLAVALREETAGGSV